MRTLLPFLLVSIFACRNDEAALAPNLQEDLPAWLSIANDADCAQCIQTVCVEQATACIEDRSCREWLGSCSPPNPGCSQRSVMVRDTSLCVVRDCREACPLEDNARACIGNYQWVAPEAPREVEFELVLESFQGPYEGVATVETCSGVTPTCDTPSALRLRLREVARARYAHTTTRERPYFRVSGDDLQPMLFYEDASIAEGHKLAVTVVTKTLFGGLVYLMQTTPDPTKGTLNVAMFDCSGEPFPGVRFELLRAGVALGGADLGTPCYFDANGSPKPPAQQASTSGRLTHGGFLNLMPGRYDVRAYVGTDLVGTIDSVIVLADTLTHVNLMPLSADERTP